jgi:hypothetical protein
MKFSESPFVTFVRGITLLVMLIALPGIAIFWNLLPREKETVRVQEPTPPKIDKSQFFWQDSNESTPSISAFAPESVYPALPEIQEIPVDPPPVIQQVAYEQVRSEVPQDFASLERHLKALGAQDYRLYKWGNRGEFFRFQCWVAPSEPYSYKKHFEYIGTDAVSVMQTVITDIEKWKKSSP